MYEVIWEQTTEDELSKTPNAEKLVKRVESYLAQSPHELGKALTGNHKGLYRYRYGDYRILYSIDRKNNEITVSRVGDRRDVYNEN